jgi:photosystem II stability/assembly factor-like uncharacterized protein
MRVYLSKCLFLLAFTGIGLLARSQQRAKAPKRVKVQRIRAVTQYKYEKDEPEQAEIDLAMQQEFEMTKDPRLGYVPRERLLTAMEVLKTKVARQQAQRAIPGITWQERGPNNVGGRTRALLYDLNDPTRKKVWAGSVGGGLWFTNDIGNPNWQHVDDLLPNLAVTCIAQSPVNPQIMYAGTGEVWTGNGIKGLGIYRSTDGGANWSILPATVNDSFNFVQKILVTQNGTVLAATSNAGLQRSINNGNTWTKALGTNIGGAFTNGAADIKIAISGTIFCSFGASGPDGIYRSSNNGASWTRIYTSAADERRIELATDSSNAAKLYAIVQGGSTGGVKKIMSGRTVTNLITAWVPVSVPLLCGEEPGGFDFTRGQARYNLAIAIDPFNSSTIYIGGIDLFRSTDGGTTWTQIAGCIGLPFVHVDKHAIIFKPGSNSEFLIGSDGGVARTTNGGSTYTAVNNGYNVTQFYSCAMHPDNLNYFLAGSQDNGTQKFTVAGMNSTTTFTGGDGGYCHIDQNNANVQISALTFNAYFVTTNNGSTFQNFFFNRKGLFINPSDFDNSANILYAADSPGTYFRWVNPGFNNTAERVILPGINSAVTFVIVSPIVSNRVYLGLQSGHVLRVDNAHTSSPVIKNVKPAGGTGAISCIAFSPASITEDHLLVTTTNFGVKHVLQTFNANSASPTYSSVDGDLPDMPVRWVLFDPRFSKQVFIATELGVWSTDSLNGNLTSWEPTNNGLANVRTDMLAYRAIDKTLTAATYGRGLYTAVLPPLNFKFAGNPDADPVKEGIVTAKAVEITAIPGTQQVKVNAGDNKLYTISVFTDDGRLLLQKNISGPASISLSGYAKGVYLVRITNNSTKEKTSKWIIL